MKQLLHYLIAGMLAGSFASCEKVVTADIRDANHKYVIEGVVNNAGRCVVQISSTADFDAVNEWKGISGATVQVTDNGGATVSLTEKSQGVYTNTSLKGTPGHTYVLTVSLNGTTYTATSTMPQAVALTAVTVSEQSVSGKQQFIANAKYTDPEESGNRYNFTQYVNRRQASAVFINNDEWSNGRAVSFSLTSPVTLQTGATDIQIGDTVAVEMQCIDAAVYKYWYSLNASAIGSDIMATPSNPVSNISGGALGYFSAHTSQTKRIIVK